MAKKEWELSHLQQLREQEERMVQEEEEEQEAMSLTYDRPEMINKVIFRRRLSTGTWEVCTSDEASHSFSPNVKNFQTNNTKELLKCNAGDNSQHYSSKSLKASDPDYYPMLDIKTDSRSHRYPKRNTRYSDSFEVTGLIDSNGISSRTRQRQNQSSCIMQHHSSINCKTNSVSDGGNTD